MKNKYMKNVQPFQLQGKCKLKLNVALISHSPDRQNLKNLPMLTTGKDVEKRELFK